MLPSFQTSEVKKTMKCGRCPQLDPSLPASSWGLCLSEPQPSCAVEDQSENLSFSSTQHLEDLAQVAEEAMAPEMLDENGLGLMDYDFDGLCNLSGVLTLTAGRKGELSLCA